MPETPTGNTIDLISPDFQLKKPRVTSIDYLENKLVLEDQHPKNIDGYAIFDLTDGFDYSDHPIAITQANGYFSNIQTNVNADLQLGIASFLDLPQEVDINQLRSENAHVVSQTLNNNTFYRIYSDTTRISYIQEVSNIRFINREGAFWIYWDHNFLSEASLKLSYAPDSVNYKDYGSVKLDYGSGYITNFIHTSGYDIDGIFRFQIIGATGEFSESWDTESNILSACKDDPNPHSAPSTFEFSSQKIGLTWDHILSFELIPCFDYAILYLQKSSQNDFTQVGWLDSSMNSITHRYQHVDKDYSYKIGFIRFGESIVFTETITVTFNGNDWELIND